MAEAIALAQRGLMTTMPNPRVGCVLAHGDGADGKVVGRGWHERAGGPHAEITALQDAGAQARGATAYVTLEPCAHQGRTGPCAEALIESGVAEVIAGSLDPNPRVDGGGLRRLEAAGVKTASGLLGDAARALNPGFFSRMTRGRPWVRLKIAQSLDGRTALADGTSQWITGPAARADVQRWRGRACAILTGVGTVLADDPSLTVRLPAEETAGQEATGQPLRVIADSRWRTPATAKTLTLPGKVLVAGNEALTRPPELAGAAECLPLVAQAGRVDLHALLKALAEREINEVHVEAGARLCGALLKAGLADEVLIYQANCLLGERGLPSFELGGPDCMENRPGLRLLERVAVGPDLRMRLAPPHTEV